MSDANYAYRQFGEARRTARARITGINASYKDLCEVCRNVRGKDTDYALEFLEQAAVGEKAIYFASHNKGKGHRRELGGRKGGWPIKSVKFVLGVVQSAAANATKLGLGNTKVAHIIANKQDTFPRMSPKGRRIMHNYETAFVEVVLEEAQKKSDEKKKGAKKSENAKPGEAKKIEATKSAEAKKEMKASEPKKAVETKQ
jgi:ribosomal protein uL22